MQTYLSGLGAAICAALLVSCSDSPVVPTSQGQGPGQSLNATITLTPDSAAGWVPEGITIRVQISGPDADSLGKLPVWWSSVDPNLVALAEPSDTAVLAIPQHDGVAKVIATVGDVADTAKIVCWEEGAPLAVTEYSADAWTATQSVAVGADGMIYVPRFDHDPALLAFDSELELAWEIPMWPTLWNVAIKDDGNLVLGRTGAVEVLSPTGALLWEDTTFASYDAAPAVDRRGHVWIGGYVGQDTLRGFAHYDATGARVAALLHTAHRAAPVIVQDSVVVTGYDRVYGISLEDSVLWVDTFSGFNSLYSWGPSVGADGRTVYLPLKTHLVAVDGLTGDILWTRQASVEGWVGYPSAPIVDTDGTIYMLYGNLVALNPDGSVRWRADSLGNNHGPYAAPAPALAAGGLLYVPCQNDVCAVNTADGSLRWRHALPSEVSAGTMAGQIMILPDSSILFSTVWLGASGTGPAYLIKLRGRYPLADAPWSVDGGDLRRTRRGHMP
jgi:outer membrane protein assembly factor BamB